MRRFILPLMVSLTATVARADSVTLQLHFDPKAAAALSKAHELVVVSGYFYGEPGPGSPLQADEMGQAYLGGEEFTVWPQDQTITFGQTLAGAPVKGVPAVYLNVNIYSARRSSEDNLLDCDFVDDLVSTLATKPQALTCKLISK